jgi:hypothetical protein
MPFEAMTTGERRNKMKKRKMSILGVAAGVMVLLMGGSNAFSEDGWWAEATDPKNFSATMTFATD